MFCRESSPDFIYHFRNPHNKLCFPPSNFAQALHIPESIWKKTTYANFRWLEEGKQRVLCNISSMRCSLITR